MRKFRKNGARTAAFLMAVSVALGSTPSTVFAASEIEVPAQVVEQNQDEVQSVETEEVTAEDASEQVQAVETEETTEETTDEEETVGNANEQAQSVEDEDITEQTTENMNEQSEDVVDEIASETTEEVSEEDSIAAEKYVLMNIPFDKFYENEIENDVAVDGFTSATLNKSRTKSMVGNNYHVNADGSDITGITFPVLVKDGVDLSAYKQVTDDDTVEITVTNRGQTSTVEYKGKDALFENPSYSYYVLSEGFQQMYKEVSVGEDGQLSFSKTVSWLSSSTLKDVETTLSTESNYGDYQLSFTGDSLSNINSENIYSVIVSTTDGSSYAMRPLENVWRGTSGIAWTSTNNVQAVHNCPTHPAHYASLMGKNISKVTYYTSTGIYEIPVNSIYVPIKVNDESSLVTVENASVKAGKTAVNVSLPEGFEPEYKVEGLENVAVENGEMTFTATKVGNYTLTVSDTSGKYADLTASFTLTTEDMPAAYNGSYDSPALVTAEGYSADDLNAYISNITSVSVDGKEYAASGRGAVVIVKEDGTIDMSTAPFKDAKDSYDIIVKATGYEDLNFSVAAVTKETYVLMNIPFDEFYKNELSNDVAVDGFTSATLNKSRTKSMAGNTYHVNADGSDITGITFPVKVADGVDLSAYKQVTDDDTVEITVTNRGQASTVEYKGKDALFENDSHAYYVLSEAPSTYKEVTVGEDGKLSFGKIVGAEAEVLSDVETTLATKSSYGDYQLSFAGDSLSKIVSDNIYSVIVSTTDGSSYAMRPLENVWLGTRGIAWTSTNNVQAVHNCPTHPAHYASLMGKSISKVTYYTSDGTYEIAVADIYVPLKVNDESSLVTVENASVKAGKTAVSVSLPEGFEPEYKVEGLENVAVADGEMTYTATKVGNYTLTVSDKSGKYADLTASFTLTTEDMPAAYNGDYNSPALVVAEGYSADDLSAYIKNITSVSVDGKEYAASGRGAVVIVKEDGTIDMSTDPFKDAKDSYDIVVKATGYADSSFTIQKVYNIENMDIELSKEKYTYAGKALTPYVKVTNGDTVLKKSVDYKVTYKNNVQPGVATVTIKGTGNYQGTVTKKFNIYPTKPVISGIGKVDKGLKLKWTEVVGASGYEIYRSKNDGEYSKVKTITSGSTVEWADTTANTNGAKYSYKILAYTKSESTTLKSKQSAAKATYKVKTPVITSLTSSAKKQMTVKWQKNTQATYYEIQYSINSNFSSAKTVKVTGANNISKVIYNLTAGKKYYVRVRGCKTVNGANYCSPWSAQKNVTIKK